MNNNTDHISDTRKKVSSIDWLIEKLTDMIHESHHSELVEHMVKAREMHKQEIVDAAECQTEKTGQSGDEYYNETFGGSNEG